jgi:hypothetical protein
MRWINVRNLYFNISIIIIFLSFSNASNAAELYLNNSLISASLKRYFVMDALVPQKLKYQVNYLLPKIGLSSVYLSSWGAAANDQLLMDRPIEVCSGYDASVCQNIGRFYKPGTSQLILTGFYRVNSNNIYSFGFNSGFSSDKLSVNPSILIGGATRFYTSKDKSSHIILEGNYWFGSKVTHRPCLDDYDREYFCGNLTAWSDFNYDHRPVSYQIKIFYEKVF